MKRVVSTFALPLVTLISSIASAATLTTLPAKTGKVIVSLSGEISPGDSDTLKEHVRKANSDNLVVSLIWLDSPGGNILEGAKLADIIRFGRIATSVVGTSKCASACFIVFAAGSEKFANYTASVGVHGASDENGQETEGSGAATVSMARIAKELGVPPGIIGKMVVTPPEQMVWLTPDELRSMSGNDDWKPSQLPPAAAANSQLPSELQPDSRSTGKESKPALSWGKPSAQKATASWCFLAAKARSGLLSASIVKIESESVSLICPSPSARPVPVSSSRGTLWLGPTSST
jgi:hypothetical protein